MTLEMAQELWTLLLLVSPLSVLDLHCLGTREGGEACETLPIPSELEVQVH